MSLKLKKLAVATAAAVAFGGATQVQSSELLFPYVVVSPSVTTVLSVINNNQYRGGDTQRLHHAIFHKTVDENAAGCGYFDRDLATSANDIQSYDLHGRLDGVRGVLYNDPSRQNNWNQAGQDFALLRGFDQARGYIVVDDVGRNYLVTNSRGITRVIDPATGETMTVNVTPDQARAFLTTWQDWINNNAMNLTANAYLLRPAFEGVRVPVYLDVLIEREADLAMQGFAPVTPAGAGTAYAAPAAVTRANVVAALRAFYHDPANQVALARGVYGPALGTTLQQRKFTVTALNPNGFFPTRIVLANKDLYGEAMVMEYGSGAAWGYQASAILSGVAVNRQGQRMEWLPSNYVAATDAFIPGDVNAQDRGIQQDHRTAAAGVGAGPFPTVSRVQRWVHPTAITPSLNGNVNTRLLVTPLEANMRGQANTGTVTLQMGPVGPGNTSVFDRDEEPYSATNQATVRCVGNVRVLPEGGADNALVPLSVVNSIQGSDSDIGWGYLSFDTNNSTQVAASIMKIEFGEAADFLGRTVGTWNNAYQIRDAQVTSRNTTIGDRQIGRTSVFATLPEMRAEVQARNPNRPAAELPASLEEAAGELGLQKDATGLFVQASS